MKRQLLSLLILSFMVCPLGAQSLRFPVCIDGKGVKKSVKITVCCHQPEFTVEALGSIHHFEKWELVEYAPFELVEERISNPHKIGSPSTQSWAFKMREPISTQIVFQRVISIPKFDAELGDKILQTRIVEVQLCNRCKPTN